MLLTNSQQTFAVQADTIWNSTGRIGCLLLLKHITTTSSVFSVSTDTGVITTVDPHALLPASRIKFISSDLLPNPLVPDLEYFAIVTGLNTFKVASSLVNANNNISISLTSVGLGTISVIEQSLSAVDPIANLLSKEVIEPGYSRRGINNVGLAQSAPHTGYKLTKVITLKNKGTTNIEYSHYLIGFGLNHISDLDLNVCSVASLPSLQVLSSGKTLKIPINLSLINDLN